MIMIMIFRTGTVCVVAFDSYHLVGMFILVFCLLRLVLALTFLTSITAIMKFTVFREQDVFGR